MPSNLPSQAPPRPRRSPARSLALKARIVEAAAAQFAAKGFGGATTRDIAQQCDIGHPLLLYHFPSKDALWVAVVRHLSHHFAESFERTLRADHGSDVVAHTRRVLKEMVSFNVLHPEYHRLMLWEVDVESAQVEALVRTHIAPLLEEVAHLVRQCQALRRFAQGEPFDLIYMLIGAASSCYTLSVEYELLTGVRPDQGAFMHRHVESCVDLFFHPAAVPATSSRARPRRPG